MALCVGVVAVLYARLATDPPTIPYHTARHNPKPQFNEAGDRMEPFNLKTERQEGYFDETVRLRVWVWINRPALWCGTLRGRPRSKKGIDPCLMIHNPHVHSQCTLRVTSCGRRRRAARTPGWPRWKTRRTWRRASGRRPWRSAGGRLTRASCVVSCPCLPARSSSTHGWMGGWTPASSNSPKKYPIHQPLARDREEAEAQVEEPPEEVDKEGITARIVRLLQPGETVLRARFSLAFVCLFCALCLLRLAWDGRGEGMGWRRVGALSPCVCVLLHVVVVPVPVVGAHVWDWRGCRWCRRGGDARRQGEDLVEALRT